MHFAVDVHTGAIRAFPLRLSPAKDVAVHFAWSAFCMQWMCVAAAMVGLFDAPLTSR